ncbi:MAG TPA: F0F1 ATP synthase subunit delta [Pyrinomonadaceae bacterium]|nr:F0F1 ATP synthase subunit delta [Pyrinomonadaceae bacterium]
MKTIKQTKREARRLFQLCRINGSLDEDRVRRVVQSVLGSKRRGHVALASEFERFVRLEKLQHAAKVESAVMLSSDLQANVRANLARMYGPGIHTTFAERPELIGGMRISVGSDVFDGSIKAGLAALEDSF